MKYIIKQIGEDFIFEELDNARRQFIDSLNLALQSATLAFDKNGSDPLDFYLAYDFQQNNGEFVVHGFNLRDEIIKSFKLDANRLHHSDQLLSIGQQLRELADEIEQRYDADPAKTLAEEQQQKERLQAEFAQNVNRSYRDILNEAKAKDEHERQHRGSGLGLPEGQKLDRHLWQTILLSKRPK